MDRKPRSDIPKMEEFQEFLLVSETAPAETLNQSILGYVRRRLNPPLWQVLPKVAVIYALSGILVLAFCPQFGLTLYAEEGLIAWFSLLGRYGCMAACGALFLGTGSLVATFALRAEEISRLQPLRHVYYASFGLLALAIFAILGAKIALGLGLAWWLGSVLGEMAAFKFGYRVRCVLVRSP